MADGNNQEALAQAQAKIDELTKKVADLAAELEKQRGIVKNAEAKFNEMSNETGENRKAAVEAARALIAAQNAREKAMEDLGRVSAELAEAKKQGPQGRQEQAEEAKKTAEEIESSLTADEQKVLDDAWKRAKPELQVRIKAEPEVRKQFLLRAKEEAKSKADADLSDWRSKPAPAAQKGGMDDLDKLFNIKKKSAEFTPPAPLSGVPRAGVRTVAEPAHRKADWVTEG